MKYNEWINEVIKTKCEEWIFIDVQYFKSETLKIP